MFFMALVARLVNDPSMACRVMHEQALKTLLQVRSRDYTSSLGQDNLHAACSEPMLLRCGHCFAQNTLIKCKLAPITPLVIA